MVLYPLTANFLQIGDVSSLYLMTTSSSIEKQAKVFLIACKVNGLSPNTLRDYAYKLNRFNSFCLELKVHDVKKFTVNHARLFILRLQETNQPVSVGDYFRCLHRFFSWLVNEEVLKENPISRARPPRAAQKVIIPFTLPQIQTLLSLCPSNTFLGIRNRAIILTFLDTGLRLSELASVQLKDIDFDKETIKVKGKGAKERVVRIGRIAQKALLRYLLIRQDQHPCLWVTEERRPITVDGIAQVIKKTLKVQAQLQGVRCSPHTFRHTFGTQALRNKADLREVQSLLGHSTLRTTLRYVATVNSEDAVISHRCFSPVDNLLK
jgi:integrase/recombinase XerC